MTFCCGVGSFYRAAYRLGEQNYDLPFHLGLFFFFFKRFAFDFDIHCRRRIVFLYICMLLAFYAANRMLVWYIYTQCLYIIYLNSNSILLQIFIPVNCRKQKSDTLSVRERKKANKKLIAL